MKVSILVTVTIEPDGVLKTPSPGIIHHEILNALTAWAMRNPLELTHQRLRLNTKLCELSLLVRALEFQSMQLATVKDILELLVEEIDANLCPRE